jgi:hypothetical protein
MPLVFDKDFEDYCERDKQAKATLRALWRLPAVPQSRLTEISARLAELESAGFISRANANKIRMALIEGLTETPE